MVPLTANVLGQLQSAHCFLTCQRIGGRGRASDTAPRMRDMSSCKGVKLSKHFLSVIDPEIKLRDCIVRRLRQIRKMIPGAGET